MGVGGLGINGSGARPRVAIVGAAPGEQRTTGAPAEADGSGGRG